MKNFKLLLCSLCLTFTSFASESNDSTDSDYETFCRVFVSALSFVDVHEKSYQSPALEQSGECSLLKEYIATIHSIIHEKYQELNSSPTEDKEVIKSKLEKFASNLLETTDLGLPYKWLHIKAPKTLREFSELRRSVGNSEKTEEARIAHLEDNRTKIDGFFEPLMQHMSVASISSIDKSNETHHGCVFSSSTPGIKHKGILYYVHGGPFAVVSNPHEMVDALISAPFKRLWDGILAGNSYGGEDYTLRSLLFFQSLTQEGYLVVALNYPGNSRHGNAFSGDYRTKIQTKSQVFNLHTQNSLSVTHCSDNFEVYLAGIIKGQMLDLTPRIRQEFNFDSTSTVTYWGHSCGGDIGQFIIQDAEFIKASGLNAIILAAPCVAYKDENPSLDGEGYKHLVEKRLDALRNATCQAPITIIVGEKDSVTPKEIDAIPMLEALNSPTYIEIPGGPHALHNMLAHCLRDIFYLEPDQKADLLTMLEKGTSSTDATVKEIANKITSSKAEMMEIFQQYKQAILNAASNKQIN